MPSIADAVIYTKLTYVGQKQTVPTATPDELLRECSVLLQIGVEVNLIDACEPFAFFLRSANAIRPYSQELEKEILRVLRGRSHSSFQT